MSSWFSDLAGKAEAFLDRMDQATASTLQDAGIVKNTPKSNPPPDHSFPRKDSSQSLLPVAQSLSYEPTASRRSSNPSKEKQAQGTTVAQVIVGSASDSPLLLNPKSRAPPPELRKELSKSVDDSGLTRASSSSGLPVVGRTTPTLKTKESDDVLLEFLNSPTSTKSHQTKTIRSTPKVKKTSAPPFVNFDPQLSQQVATLPAPLLSPVKAQPSFTTGERERSQWDISDITTTTMTTSPRSQETPPKEDESMRGKSEETDTPYERVSPTGLQGEEGGTRVPHDSETVSENYQKSDFSESQPPAPLADHGEAQSKAPSGVDQTLLAEVGTLRQKVSNLELENKLLKREVGSLNDEMGTLMTRLNEASDSSSRYDREIQSLREQVSQSDHVIRQLRSHDDDLQALLEARDQQIAVLRTQLAEGDKAAELLRVHVSAAQREKEQ